MLSCTLAVFKVDHWEWGLDREGLIFQQDNHPKDTCQGSVKWFKRNRINVLKWSAQLSDPSYLNICGTTSKGCLVQMGPSHEPWEWVRVERDGITKEGHVKLMGSMPRRTEAIIKAKPLTSTKTD